MARTGRKNRYKKSNSSVNKNDDEIISKLDNLAKNTKKQNKSIKSPRKFNNNVMVLSIVGIIGLSLVGGIVLFSGDGGSNILNPGGNSGLGSSITSMCINHSELGTHDHFNLNLYVNDEFKPLPANIGVINDCMRPVHTHEPGTYVHIEMPTGVARPTLSDFFSIYRLTSNSATFGENELLGQIGTVTATNLGLVITDFVNYEPRDGDTITLKVATN